MFTDSVGLQFRKGTVGPALLHSVMSGAQEHLGAGTSGPAVAGIVPARAEGVTFKRVS